LKIVIIGQPKTGTSALFFKIKNSFQGDSIGLFEPPPDQIPTLESGDAPVLAKVLLLNDGRQHEYIKRFDKQIFLTRDPRDRLVSALLYSVRDSTYFNNDAKVNRLVSVLERKEGDPSSIPFADLWKLCIELDDRTSYAAWVANLPRSLDFVLRFHAGNPDLFAFKYEDLIDEKLDGLAAYLGMDLKGEARVTGDYSRVERTKGYGNWRDWFVNSDIELFRPACREYMKTFGYGDDWTLNATPVVRQEHASGYVRRLVKERRSLAFPEQG
jgi:hypothetical protein